MKLEDFQFCTILQSEVIDWVGQDESAGNKPYQGHGRGEQRGICFNLYFYKLGPNIEQYGSLKVLTEMGKSVVQSEESTRREGERLSNRGPFLFISHGTQ